MEKLNAKAEQMKRHLFIGRIMTEIGEEKTIEILKDLLDAFKLIDNQYNYKLEPLKICVGCGCLEDEIPGLKAANPKMLACCPESKFITVREYFDNSLLVPQK